MLLKVLADTARSRARERCALELEAAVRRLVDEGSDPAIEAAGLLREMGRG